MKYNFYFLWLSIALFFVSCQEEGESVVVKGPNLLIKLKVSSDRPRLNNLGEIETVESGNAALSPQIQSLGLHYLELLPTPNTMYGDGAILYQGAETDLGGDNAINFKKCKLYSLNDEVYLSIPIEDIAPGTYMYPRAMIAYQKVKVPILFNGADLEANIATFLGFNTYIEKFDIEDETITVFDDKLQGFWGLEINYAGFSTSFEGQSPPNETTAPNPLYATSPIPMGTCLVTGSFVEPLIIKGNETDDITVEITFSANQSFEWKELVQDGKFDPNIGESPFDMGLRGLSARFY